MARAINNFTSGKVDSDGRLELQGETSDPLTGQKATSPETEAIGVVIISVEGPERRCEATVKQPQASSWPAQCPASENPFRSGDDVYLIGRATITGEEDDLVWANMLRLG